MIGRLLSWMRGAPRNEREETMGAEKQLEEKKESLDRTIEKGRLCADRLKRVSDKQVAEANVAIATIRGLLSMLQDRENNQ
jgi:hypothetical protein